MALKCMNVWGKRWHYCIFFFLLRPTGEPRGAHLASWCRGVISETDTHMSLIEVNPLGGEEPNHETAAGIRAVRWWSADASISIQLHFDPLNSDLLTARLELHSDRFCAENNNITALWNLIIHCNATCARVGFSKVNTPTDSIDSKQLKHKQALRCWMKHFPPPTEQTKRQRCSQPNNQTSQSVLYL